MKKVKPHSQKNQNQYKPSLSRIIAIEIESAVKDTRTFTLEFLDDPARKQFQYLPGQFVELSVAGAGEAPISITSSPTQPHPEFCIKRMGVVTRAIHNLSVGDTIGVRGPYGNTFPLETMEGKNIIFVAGGIGLAPLRSLIIYMLDAQHRNRYKDITIIYGARSPGDLLFKRDLKQWAERQDVTYHVIKFVLQGLTKLGFTPDQIITTLEMRMKCGIGKCGRCNIGPYYVCIDGPVFSYRQILGMPQEY